MSEASETESQTENFAVGVVKFCETLPNSIAGRKIAGQFIDASTSVAANYRAACRGTRGHFRLEARHRRRRSRRKRAVAAHHPRRTASRRQWPLEQEAHELASIFTASLRTARGQRKRSSGPPNPPIPNLQSDNIL